MAALRDGDWTEQEEAPAGTDADQTDLPEPVDDPDDEFERVIAQAMRDDTCKMLRLMTTALESGMDPVRGLFLVEAYVIGAKHQLAELTSGGGPAVGDLGGDYADDDYGGGMVGMAPGGAARYRDGRLGARLQPQGRRARRGMYQYQKAAGAEMMEQLGTLAQGVQQTTQNQAWRDAVQALASAKETKDPALIAVAEVRARREADRLRAEDEGEPHGGPQPRDELPRLVAQAPYQTPTGGPPAAVIPPGPLQLPPRRDTNDDNDVPF